MIIVPDNDKRKVVLDKLREFKDAAWELVWTQEEVDDFSRQVRHLNTLELGPRPAGASTLGGSEDKKPAPTEAETAEDAMDRPGDEMPEDDITGHKPAPAPSLATKPLPGAEPGSDAPSDPPNNPSVKIPF